MEGPLPDIFRGFCRESSDGFLVIINRELNEWHADSVSLSNQAYHSTTYLTSRFAMEETMEKVFHPRRVLLRDRGVPAIHEVELDGDDVPLAARCHAVVDVPDWLCL